MGKVIGIATRKKTKAPMDEHTSATISFNAGVNEDSRGKKQGKRQVTLLSNESWHSTCNELGQMIPWTTRRANFLIEGIPLEGQTGKKLQIGTALLEITGELVPCNRMDEQFAGLTNALEKDWRGGVTCKVLSEGIVNLNDEIILI